MDLISNALNLDPEKKKLCGDFIVSLVSDDKELYLTASANQVNLLATRDSKAKLLDQAFLLVQLGSLSW